MNKLKVTAAFLAFVMCMGLTACGSKTENNGGSVADSNNSSAANNDSNGNDTDSGDDTITGETFDMGTFTVLVPDGWVAQEYKDMDQVKLYKADSLDNTFFAPEIDITYKADTTYELFTSIYESYEEVSPITIGDYTWNGVQGVYSSSKDCLSLNTTVGNGYIAADIWVKVGESTISIDDADVNAILSSIAVK